MHTRPALAPGRALGPPGAPAPALGAAPLLGAGRVPGGRHRQVERHGPGGRGRGGGGVLLGVVVPEGVGPVSDADAGTGTERRGYKRATSECVDGMVQLRV